METWNWDAIYTAAGRAVEYFNLLEALFWVALAAGFARAASRQGPDKRTQLVAALLFTLFGATDLAEMRSLAWYRPWWLLAANAFCALGLLATWARYLLTNRERKSSK